jgi:hypothetical protein
VNSFCGECGEWAVGQVSLDGRRGTFRCEACGHRIERAVAPLLVVTGASGSGKTAILEPLRQLVPGVAVFDKDLMWAADWDQAYNNFFRVASALAQAGVQAVIVGTITPENVEGLADRDLVGEIAYLNLHCDDAERERRLRARPAWRRSSDEAFIERHRRFAQWLLDHMETVRTDESTVEEVAAAVAAWVTGHMRPQPGGLHNLTLYVAPDEFDGVRRFYADVLGCGPLFEEPGHICCFDVSGDGRPLALCIHEAEPSAGHPAGTRELFVWVPDVEDARRRAEAAGHAARTVARGELQLTDPAGNRLRLHRPR